MSLLRRLRSAFALDREAFALSMRAVGLLLVARAQLRLSGFDVIRSGLEGVTPGSRCGPDYPGAVRRAVSRAARTVPGSRCLPQAIVAFRLLRSGGHPAELTIGVRRAPDAATVMHAHAWVRSGPRLVTGGDTELDLTGYSPLTEIRAGV